MDLSLVVVAFLAGFAISVVTTPAGVSGAVFLLPVQLSVLGVPNPAVTPTNLLYNVVATPGGLLRFRRNGTLRSPLTRTLLIGTVPGVVVGALIRTLLAPSPQVFRLIVASLLFPLGGWLVARSVGAGGSSPGPAVEPSRRRIAPLAFVVGVLGGVYGIGGGSILGPILVARGLPVARVAPAALMSTFVTSVVGAIAFLGLAAVAPGDVAPDWSIGLATGVGGLLGGYVGASLQPRVPDRGLRALLGALAMAVAIGYVLQAVA